MILRSWALAVLLLAALPGQWRERIEKQETRPVAVHIWQSNTGNIDEAASWSTAVAASAWQTADEVLVDGSRSQKSLSSGLAQSGVDITKITVTDGFTGDIGAPGNPLNLGGVVFILYQGQGRLFYKSSNSSYLDRIIVNSPNLLDAVYLDAAATSGFILVLVESGAVVMAETALWRPTGSGLSQAAVVGQDASLVMRASGDQTPIAPPMIHVTGGYMSTSTRGFEAASIPRIVVGGGYLHVRNLINNLGIMQLGGYIDFDIKSGLGESGARWQLINGTADFRKCQHEFTDFDYSFIGPDMVIRSGPVMDEKVFTVANGIIADLRTTRP